MRMMELATDATKIDTCIYMLTATILYIRAERINYVK